jgi:REP element-mobilizing transposase RayT
MHLFYQDEDYLQFLGLLKKALDATGVTLWAFVLMTNHYHFVLSATSDELTRLMRWVNHSYSLYHNKKHGLLGHAFESPYKCHLQTSLFLLMYRIAYVFLNPVDAHIVVRPEDYRWSSYHSFMGLAGSPLAVNPFPVLTLLADNPQEARAQFTVILARQANRPKVRPVDAFSWSAVLQDQFAALLDEAVRRKDGLAGEDPVLVAIYWGRQLGIPPRAMRPALPDGARREVSKSLYKFCKRLESNPALAALLSCP